MHGANPAMAPSWFYGGGAGQWLHLQPAEGIVKGQWIMEIRQFFRLLRLRLY